MQIRNPLPTWKILVNPPPKTHTIMGQDSPLSTRCFVVNFSHNHASISSFPIASLAPSKVPTSVENTPTRHGYIMIPPFVNLTHGLWPHSSFEAQLKAKYWRFFGSGNTRQRSLMQRESRSKSTKTYIQ